MSVIAILFILFIFVNPFIPMPDWMRYWDEILTLACVGFGIISLFLRRRRGGISRTDARFRMIVGCTLCLCVIGILGNLFFSLQPSLNAIVRDIVGFIKFPVILIVLYYSNFYSAIEKHIKNIIIPLLAAFVFIITLLGIVSIFCDIGLSQTTDFRGGIYPYQFLASHPTSLVVSLALIWCTLITLETARYSKLFFVCYIFISISMILTMRTKAFVFVALVWYVKYFTEIKWISWFTKRYKVIYWISIAAVVFIASYSKLKLYSTFGGSGRFDLYSGGVYLLKECFPIGSGFGTYASHVSGLFPSRVYDLISVSEIFDLSGKATSIIGDTGYPYYVGQFGALGIVFFTILFFDLFKQCSYKALDNYGCLFILLYVLVGLTTESTLLNYGAQIAVVLALNLRISEKNRIKDMMCRSQFKDA